MLLDAITQVEEDSMPVAHQDNSMPASARGGGEDANDATDGADDEDNNDGDNDGGDNDPSDDKNGDEQDSIEVCEDREGNDEGDVDKLSDNLAHSYILNPWTGPQMLQCPLITPLLQLLALQCLTVLSCHPFTLALQLLSNLVLQHVRVLQPTSQLMQRLHALQCLTH